MERLLHSYHSPSRGTALSGQDTGLLNLVDLSLGWSLNQFPSISSGFLRDWLRKIESGSGPKKGKKGDPIMQKSKWFSGPPAPTGPQSVPISIPLVRGASLSGS